MSTTEFETLVYIIVAIACCIAAFLGYQAGSQR